ncbi:MAG: PEP-CTERM sorting domain-containing protein [Verrucomicrobia bacterium]|nr:PEP-CTERM sorting domain-containing protein [Verrucomicrobiota bacterium]MCH8514525.1 PEP-CTERM sorting domain-containing protein [Kiritimatiellia bacterium]
MKKRILIKFCIPLAFAAAMAHGQVQTMLIDFGTNTGVPNSPDGNGNLWNSGITGTGTFQLQDTSGNANVATAVLSGTFSDTNNDQGWDDRTEVPSWATGSVTEALNDRLFQGRRQAGTLVLSGLNPNLSYNIELAAAFQADSGSAGNSSGFLSMFALGGLNPVVPVEARLDPNNNSPLALNTDQNQFTNISNKGNAFDEGGYEWQVRTGAGQNDEGWIGWYGVSPTLAGEISITFAGGENNLSRGGWNAMSISAIPEPGTLFLLGLGLAIVIGHRRRK